MTFSRELSIRLDNKLIIPDDESVDASQIQLTKI